MQCRHWKSTSVMILTLEVDISLKSISTNRKVFEHVKACSVTRATGWFHWSCCSCVFVVASWVVVITTKNDSVCVETSRKDIKFVVCIHFFVDTLDLSLFLGAEMRVSFLLFCQGCSNTSASFPVLTWWPVPGREPCWWSSHARSNSNTTFLT